MRTIGRIISVQQNLVIVNGIEGAESYKIPVDNFPINFNFGQCKYISYDKSTLNSILPINSDNSTRIAKIAFQSEEVELWNLSAVKYISKSTRISGLDVKKLDKILPEIPSSELIKQGLSYEVILKYPAIITTRSYIDKFFILSTLIEKNIDFSKYKRHPLMDLMIDLIQDNYKAGINEALLNKLNRAFLVDSRLYAIAPLKHKIEYLLEKLNSEENAEDEKKLNELIEQNPEAIRFLSLKKVMEYTDFVYRFDSVELVNKMFHVADKYWDGLTNLQKLYIILKASKSKERIKELILNLKNGRENNKLIRALLLILSNSIYNKAYQTKDYNIFEVVDKLIRSHFKTMYYAEKHLYDQLLKKCPVGLTTYCEAARIKDESSPLGFKVSFSLYEEVYCQHCDDKKCVIDIVKIKVTPETYNSWEQWGLKELLESCNFDVPMNLYDSVSDYTFKLAKRINSSLQQL